MLFLVLKTEYYSIPLFPPPSLPPSLPPLPHPSLPPSPLQVRHSPEGIECRALQLTTDHNVNVPEVREQYIEEHADMPDAVVCKRGFYRVKGKITVRALARAATRQG